MGRGWIGHWWSTVCSSALHSQVAEGASHLCDQERQRPPPVPRRFSRTHAVFGSAIPRRWMPVSEVKARSFVVLCKLPHSIGDPPRVPHADWSRYPGAMARCARGSLALLRRSSAGWVPANIGRLSVGLGRRLPVIIRKASLMAGSVRRVWALRHQTGG